MLLLFNIISPRDVHLRWGNVVICAITITGRLKPFRLAVKWNREGKKSNKHACSAIKISEVRERRTLNLIANWVVFLQFPSPSGFLYNQAFSYCGTRTKHLHFNPVESDFLHSLHLPRALSLKRNAQSPIENQLKCIIYVFLTVIPHSQPSRSQ